MAICPSICRVPGIHSLSAGGCLLLISLIPTTNTVPPCRGFSCLRHGALLYQAIVGLLFLFGKLSAHGPQPIQCGGGTDLAAMMGKEETLRRLNAAIEAL